MSSSSVQIAPAQKSGWGSERGTNESWTLEGFTIKTALSRAAGFPETRIELPPTLDQQARFDFFVSGLGGSSRESGRRDVRERLLHQGIEQHFNVRVSREPRTMDVCVLSLPHGPMPALRANPELSVDFGADFAGGHVSFAVPSDGTDPPTPEALQELFRTMESAQSHLAAGFITGASASGTSMEVFAQMLEQGLDRLVVDETHLTGSFDLQVAGEAASTAEFFQMLRDQFGLAVTPATREVTLLVVRPA